MSCNWVYSVELACFREGVVSLALKEEAMCPLKRLCLEPTIFYNYCHVFNFPFKKWDLLCCWKDGQIPVTKKFGGSKLFVSVPARVHGFSMESVLIMLVNDFWCHWEEMVPPLTSPWFLSSFGYNQSQYLSGLAVKFEKWGHHVRLVLLFPSWKFPVRIGRELEVTPSAPSICDTTKLNNLSPLV